VRLSDARRTRDFPLGGRSGAEAAQSAENDPSGHQALRLGDVRRTFDLPLGGRGGVKAALSAGGFPSGRQAVCLGDILCRKSNHSLQGYSHEAYFQIKEQRSCAGGVHQRGGANCAAGAAGSCEPLVAFLAHPVDRVLSAFFQAYQQNKGGKGGDKVCGGCYFLRCRPSSRCGSPGPRSSRASTRPRGT
jgi:hypothetical protein